MSKQIQPIINETAAVTHHPRAFPSFPNLWAWLRSTAAEWSYPAADKRDLRLDVLRGFAVVVMVVDHMGGSSWLYLLTGGNSFFVSGAEAFIFISGLVVGMVYGGIALKQGLRAAQLKALQRGWTLYKLTVVLTLLFAAFSMAFNLDWAHDLTIGNPLQFAWNVVTLHETMYFTDIPLLYTFLMLLAAGGLALLYYRKTALLLALSAGGWLAFQLVPAQAQLPWAIDGNTTFHLAAWQFLFFAAMALGYHRERITAFLRQLPRWPYLVFSGLLVVWLVRLYDTQGAWLGHLFPGLDTHAFLSEFFLKSALAPGRLLASVILFQFAYLAATLFWKPIWTLLGWLLMPLGQNSLYSYTMHVVVVGLFYGALPYLPGHVLTMGTLNTSLQLLVVLLLWAMIQKRFLFSVVPR